MDPQPGPPQPDLLIGQTVGNYLVTQKLGEGGMGSVYLAEHPTIGKKVALKVLHAEFSTNPEVADRFFTEAKAVNAIGHPNIVDIVDYGVIQTGPRGEHRLVYFIMEYLSGLTLSQVIRTEAPLPPERALTIALQVADALAASHKCQIVHRDLKPDNIILMSRGRERDVVKLLDFGIAKLTNDSRGSSRTRTGLVLGTPAYMSPEQCEGRASVDHRTDIYALGICLYEMLVGRVPFIGEGYGEILVQHLTQKPIEPSRYRMMSPHVEQVVMKALEKRVELRYPTMDEFIRAMADPVGYVEAHGGVGGFLAKQLMPSNTPLPPVRPTPAVLTPIPGISTPAPGTLTSPSPTTLSAAAGQVGSPRSKTGFVIAGVLVVAAAGVGVFVVMSGKDKKPDAPTNVVSMGTGSSETGSAVVVQPTKGSAAVVVEPTKGSAAVAVEPAKGSDVAAGSAAVATGSAATGSAATVATDPKGSAAVENPMVTLEVKSSPDGAEILVNGVDTTKKTAATLTIPRSKTPATILLRLKGYDDYVIKNVMLDGGEITENAALKKTSSSSTTVMHTGGGHGSGHAPGKGSGTTKQCDTCLERPD